MHQHLFFNILCFSLLCPATTFWMHLPSVICLFHIWESDNIRTSTLALPSLALDIWPGYSAIYLMVDETIQGFMSCWRVSDSHRKNQALKNHCTEKKQKHIQAHLI